MRTNGAANVLVVDDDPKAVEAIRAILGKMGEYNVQVARSGQECLHTVTQALPDLILLDTVMPEMDGIQVLKELQARTECRAVPVLMVSVDAPLDRIAACFELGASGFLIKPFDADNLYRQVQSAIARYRASKLQYHRPR
jgi:CheY-like chemotaxis protein